MYDNSGEIKNITESLFEYNNRGYLSKETINVRDSKVKKETINEYNIRGYVGKETIIICNLDGNIINKSEKEYDKYGKLLLKISESFYDNNFKFVYLKECLYEYNDSLEKIKEINKYYDSNGNEISLPLFENK